MTGAAIRTGLVGVLSMLALSLSMAGRSDSAESEQPVVRVYGAAPVAPKSETPQEAALKSLGCQSCHTASEAVTMHKSDAVVLGCADCHGGDAQVTAPKGLAKSDPRYAKLRDQAHVLPRYPVAWNFPSSAKPKESYTLLNREAPEFIRFVNP